ncbi:MAG: RNA polymerase sigma factor [Acidobacteriota bacterium]
MPASESDRALREHLLVLRAQLGSRDAFRSLFESYQPRLLYYLRRRLGPAEAEDVLQEVWMTVLQKITRLQNPRAFKAWIYRIAHHRAISSRRRQRDELSLDALPEGLDPTPARAVDEAEQAFAGFPLEEVLRQLDLLAPSHREVLTLRFLEELSYAEIAEVLGRSLGTVRSRLHYAKKTLQERLSGQRPVQVQDGTHHE